MRSPLFAQARDQMQTLLFWYEKAILGGLPGEPAALNEGRHALRGLEHTREDAQVLPIPDDTLRRELGRAFGGLVIACQELVAWVGEGAARLRPLYAAAFNPCTPSEEAQQAQQARLEAWNAAHIPVVNEWQTVWKANVLRAWERLFQAEQQLDKLPDLPEDEAPAEPDRAPGPSMDPHQAHAEAPPCSIVYLGHRQYRLDDGPPAIVLEAEDDVLQALLGGAIDGMIAVDCERLGELSGLSADDAGKVLRELRSRYGGRFALAIEPPGGKGRGGYLVRIRRHPQAPAAE
jgi:hypothetical protein